jgi:hypothetical protein
MLTYQLLTMEKPMTHPFALSIDDLTCLELVDEEQPIEGGAAKAIQFVTVKSPFDGGPGCILTIGYNYENGGHPASM